MSRREIIRKIGELMSLRMAVNTSGGGLEATPEFYWSEPQLEEYFDALTREFEIKERITAINKKIDYAQEIQSTLRALLTEASAHRMELIIIALIAVEVVVVLIREGPELWDKLITPGISSLLGVVGVDWPVEEGGEGDGGREKARRREDEWYELERVAVNSGGRRFNGAEYPSESSPVLRELGAGTSSGWGLTYHGDRRLV